jgi:hypothetical protein
MKLLRRHFDYTTRLHMKRRVENIDYRFLAALIALCAGVYLAVTYL